jgi:hypothetical protein
MRLQLAPEEPEAGPWRTQPLAVLVEALAQAQRVPGGIVSGRPVIVAFNGRGNGGKTSLAARIALAVPGSAVIQTDDIAWAHSRFGRESRTARRGAVAARGQQGEERSDPVSFLGRVAEQAVGVDGVPVAPPVPGPGEVARGFEVGHDGLDGAFGEADDGGDVSDPGFGIAGDLYQHVPVPGQVLDTYPSLADALARRHKPSTT